MARVKRVPYEDAMRRSAPTEGLGRPITGRGIAIAIGLYLALNLAWAVISPLIRP